MVRETHGILDVSVLAVSLAVERKGNDGETGEKGKEYFEHSSVFLSYILLLYVLEGYRGRMGYLVGRNKAKIRVTVREKADRETHKRSTSLIAWPASRGETEDTSKYFSRR